MAIVGTAKPMGPGRAGEEGENGLKTFYRTYVVRTDDKNDGPNLVRGATGLPRLGDPYNGHETAVCVGLFPRQHPNSWFVWHVEVEWSTHSVDRDENPLNTKTEIEYGYETYEDPIAGTARVGADVTSAQGSSDEYGNPINNTNTQDSGVGHYGFPILNTAGDPMPGILTAPNFYPVVRVTRNEASFTAIKAIQYGNTVNGVSWNGMLPRQVWLKPIEATSEVQYAAGIDQPDIRYWRVRYTFVLKAATWDRQLLNIGKNYLKLKTGSTTIYEKLPFLKNGQPVFDLLKADGTAYAADTPTANKKAVWLRFRVLREVDFGPLSINLNLALNELRKRSA